MNTAAISYCYAHFWQLLLLVFNRNLRLISPYFPYEVGYD